MTSSVTERGARRPPSTVDDYRREARSMLPRAMWNSLCGDEGELGWETSANNLAAFKATKLRPRVLVDVSRLSLQTTVLGREIGLPVLIAPSGTQQRWHRDGEVASARAAARAGVVMSLSSASTYSIEEVAAAGADLWLQLYVMRNRRVTEHLVRRAEDAGYRALVLTVDRPGGSATPELDPRFAGATSEPDYDFDAEWTHAPALQEDRILKNFRDLDVDGTRFRRPADLTAQIEDSLTWKDLEWLRGLTPLPLVLKGIQNGDDVRLAREHGLEAVVVSNHGGVVVRDARGTMEVLPEAVDAAAGALEVYLDGGVRSGDDVLKALAVGAQAVLVGRAQLWGLTVGGEDGVLDVLEIIRRELHHAMKLCGVADVRRVPRDLVVR
jgi:4-hydroxymandelate oxidase